MTFLLENPVLGISMALAVCSVIYLFVSGGQTDMRFKTGYKGNNKPISLGIRVRNTMIGLSLAGILYVIHFQFFDKKTRDSKYSKIGVVNTKSGVNFRTDTLVVDETVILSIPYQDTVNIVTDGLKTTWVQVLYQDKRGWVNKQFIDKVPDSSGE